MPELGLKRKVVVKEQYGSVHAVEKKIPDISLEVVLQPQWCDSGSLSGR